MNVQFAPMPEPADNEYDESISDYFLFSCNGFLPTGYRYNRGTRCLMKYASVSKIRICLLKNRDN